MNRIASFLIVTSAILILSLTPSYALTCHALTSGNHLLTFDSSTPGTVTDVTLTMPDAAYSVVGIDIRTTTQTVGAANPGVGSLWGIAFNGTQNFRLCTINSTSGAVTFIGGVLVMDASANADAFGFGFDPSRDRFQFISVQNNYVIDPNTLSRTKVTDITFPTAFPAQSGAAFSTASFGGTSLFYNISRQASPRTLQVSSNISSGSLSQIGSGGIGANVNAPMGMDIEGSFFLLANSDDVHLYSINRSNGTKSDLGLIGGAAPGFRGLAIRPASFPPQLAVSVKIKGKKKVTTSSSTLKIKGTASSEAGITSVQYQIGKKSFKVAKGTTSWNFKAKLKPGTNKITVQAIGGNDILSAPAKIKVVRK